jgi:hypothetical protein
LEERQSLRTKVELYRDIIVILNEFNEGRKDLSNQHVVPKSNETDKGRIET